jgi:hypothetical protein
MQVYVYARDGVLHVSLHYDSAGPGPDGGPWAYYGPHDAIPTVVLGGDGEPVYEALPGNRRRARDPGLEADLAQLRKTGTDEPGDYLDPGDR